MSLIKNKFIGAGEVIEDQIVDGVLLKGASQNAIFDALALKVDSSLLGANNGVATLDNNGKLPSSQLTIEAFEYKGNYNASTDSPSLEDGTGNTGDVYHVSVGGTQDFGAGNITFVVGDKVVYNGSIWEKWEVVNPADSDAVPEGSSNLYFTEARVRDTLITGFTSGAGTVAATDSVLEAIEKLDGNIDALSMSGLTTAKQNITLAGGHITNQYVDLAEEIVASSLQLFVDGVHQVEGSDYSLSLEGGVTRLTFAGPLASAGAAALIAGDVLNISYLY